jgi:hypothetical protein
MFKVPLREWRDKLETVNEKDCIEDVSDFKIALNDLIRLNCGTLNENG